MHRLAIVWSWVACCGVLLSGATLSAAELVTLTPQTWDAYAAAGKECDRIYGDLVLKNDKIVVIVAKPVAGRNANMTVRNAGGAIIDLTSSTLPNDQLSAFYPAGKTTDWREIEIDAPADAQPAIIDPAKAHVKAERVHLTVKTVASDTAPLIETRYTLQDGWPYVLIETTWHHTGKEPLELQPFDEMRADASFTRADPGEMSLFWVYDKWWDQAYGVVADGATITAGPDARGHKLQYTIDDEKTVEVQPGSSFRLLRRLFPSRNHAQLRAVAEHLAHDPLTDVAMEVVDTKNEPIAGADVEILTDQLEYATARTGADGRLSLQLPEDDGPFTVKIRSQPHGEVEAKLDSAKVRVEMPAAGVVVAQITSETGDKIPCKVEFRGLDDTPSPYFNHKSGEHAVENLYYSHDGAFRRAIAPGKYQCIISYGSEHDAVFTTINIQRGEETPLKAKLIRSVQTPGWLSADYHSHSSPSGDNTSSQLGRVLNLLCEQIEFAPCTEHNRLSSYDPHLLKLGAKERMATCTGIELTDTPLPINHHNAFPLVLKPRTQNNGGPESDLDVELKVTRLATWDNSSEKVIQQNHPDIGGLYFDRDGDGTPDGGYAKALPQFNCIEVHPPHTIFQGALVGATGRKKNNTIFNWLQLLNQGHRLPGTVNTDAHYNFHGSGWLRIYVKSPTDEPGQGKIADLVQATRRGHILMTNGPYLEVTAETGKGGDRRKAEIGDDLIAPGGKCSLHVRVQCANWYDVDRVQVLLSGRFVEELNFTRAKTPGRFSGGVVKFDHTIPLELERDEHVIVVAAGMSSTMGPVRGPDHEKEMPIAVSNPIYVDVDGGGFKANGDTLGAPLPVIAAKAGN